MRLATGGSKPPPQLGNWPFPPKQPSKPKQHNQPTKPNQSKPAREAATRLPPPHLQGASTCTQTSVIRCTPAAS